jgi:cysteine synthase A
VNEYRREPRLRAYGFFTVAAGVGALVKFVPIAANVENKVLHSPPAPTAIHLPLAPTEHDLADSGRGLVAEATVHYVAGTSRQAQFMQIRDGVVEAIGHTPLIKLERASAATGCTILGKAEFMNPGGSVKDRPGRQMILEAEKRGELKPGGLVVEGTAGNTGIGLAIVAAARGYRTLIVIPNTQSQEKKDMLRLVGAELVEVPALPYSNPDNYQHVARRLADKLRKTESNGVLFADQWNNLDNRKAHYESTGPEIWDETQGKVDGFICAVGTGGTLAGTSTFLREKNKDVVIGCADPRGAAMYNLFKTGEAKSTEGGSITEGIGLGRVTAIIKDIKVERPYLIPDEEAVPVIFDLLEHEGLCLGGSSGINVAGAIRLAKDMGPGHTIVTILADSGTRYQSKLFNPEFLRSRKLPVPQWIERKTNVEIPFEKK